MKDLPPQYKWLLDESKPQIMREMLDLYGVYEYAGEENNPMILEWAKEIKKYVGIEYLHDSTAWCGLIMGVCAHRAGLTPPRICVRAKEWLKYGWAIDTPVTGSVLIFMRKGGGHVGLYVAEDENHFHVLGGNQQDMVKIVPIRKERLISARQCPTLYATNPYMRRIFMDKVGLISHNEK